MQPKKLFYRTVLRGITKDAATEDVLYLGTVVRSSKTDFENDAPKSVQEVLDVLNSLADDEWPNWPDTEFVPDGVVEVYQVQDHETDDYLTMIRVPCRSAKLARA